MSDKVKLASLGLGRWGKLLARSAEASGMAEVVTCYARRPGGREEFAAEIGCRAADSVAEMLDDEEIDGVLIATSHQSHRPLIEQAASAGKAVFVEKPFTTTVADGRAAVAAAESAGIVLQVGHQRRRSSADRRLHAMVAAGELGDIQGLHGIQSIPNGFKMPPEAWRWDADQSPLGSMTSLGVHKIDSMGYLAGSIASVFCFTRPGRDVTIDESTVLALQFENGAVGTLATSFFTPVISELSVYGTKASGYVTADGTRLHVQRTGESERSEVALDPVDPVVDQLAEFARAIRGEVAVEVDGRAGLAVVAVMEAAVTSAENGCAVEVAPIM